MRHSSMSASAIERMTASGTARNEKVRVFFAAVRNAEFWNSFTKLSRNTKLREPTQSMTE